MQNQNQPKALTNAQLLALSSQKGIENLTVHTIPVEHSYKIVKFKQEFNKGMKAYNEAREAIVKQVGIDDEQKFNKDFKELKGLKSRDKEQEKKYNDMLAKKKELNGLVNGLLKDTVKLESKTIPYSVWKALQDENKGEKYDMFSGQVFTIKELKDDDDATMQREDVETILEDILWVIPEEKEEQ